MVPAIIVPVFLIQTKAVTKSPSQMISTTDFVMLSYTPDMIQVGIKCACQTLTYTFKPMIGNRLNGLRRIVAGKAVELALKRHLNNAEIPHNMLGSTPFTDPDLYDIAVGGRR